MHRANSTNSAENIEILFFERNTGLYLYYLKPIKKYHFHRFIIPASAAMPTKAAAPFPPPSIDLKHDLPQGVARFDLGMGGGGVFKRQCPADFYG